MTDRFTGYHSEIPFKREQVVVIPAGTVVRTMHPARKTYTTKRKQTVKIDHTLPGQSMTIGMMTDKDRYYYPEHKATFDRYDEMILDARTHPDNEIGSKMWREAHEMKVHVSNPSIRWPGTGGYWCEVDINALLADSEKTS